MVHNGCYKIIDFGFSKKLELKNEKDQTQNTLLGTPTTMAPEVFLRKKYGLKVIVLLLRPIFGLSELSFSNLFLESNLMIQTTPRHSMPKLKKNFINVSPSNMMVLHCP